MRIQRRGMLVFLALALCAGCHATVSRSVYNGLEGLKGGYVAANDVRNAYCAPKPQPKPAICIDSYKPMTAAYHVLLEGTRLLAAYVVNKDASVAAQLNALAAEIPGIVLEVTVISGQFRDATGARPPSTVPAAPVH